MKEFDLSLDPAEALTIRRVISPPRSPGKGNATYRCDAWLSPLLVENGWTLVGYHSKQRSKAFLSPPGGERAASFTIHALIPSDQAILRLAAAMIRFATRPPGPGDPWVFDGRLGRNRATFYKGGRRIWGTEVAMLGYSGEAEDRRRDRLPTLEISLCGIWGTTLFWLDGYDQPPTWDRTQYFSALAPGVPRRIDSGRH